MLRKMNNYQILFSLRVLKNILNNFIDVFFVLYFLTVSNSNILSLGIYKLIAIVAKFLQKRKKNLFIKNWNRSLFFLFFSHYIFKRKNSKLYVFYRFIIWLRRRVLLFGF